MAICKKCGTKVLPTFGHNKHGGTTYKCPHCGHRYNKRPE